MVAQVVCNFLEMCMGWMAFDWTVRSDMQETYRSALSMAEQGLQLLMHLQPRVKDLETIISAEDEEAVRDTIMLLVRICDSVHRCGQGRSYAGAETRVMMPVLTLGATGRRMSAHVRGHKVLGAPRSAYRA